MKLNFPFLFFLILRWSLLSFPITVRRPQRIRIPVPGVSVFLYPFLWNSILFSSFFPDLLITFLWTVRLSFFFSSLFYHSFLSFVSVCLSWTYATFHRECFYVTGTLLSWSPILFFLILRWSLLSFPIDGLVVNDKTFLSDSLLTIQSFSSWSSAGLCCPSRSPENKKSWSSKE